MTQSPMRIGKIEMYNRYRSTLVVTLVLLLHWGILWNLTGRVAATDDLGAQKLPPIVQLSLVETPMHTVHQNISTHRNTGNLDQQNAKTAVRLKPAPAIKTTGTEAVAALIATPLTATAPVTPTTFAAPEPAHPSTNTAVPTQKSLPSSDAGYLHNPAPKYPELSRRLGEKGRVAVRVLIGADGHAVQVELEQSSGFARLDQAAMQTVMGWRYAPGMEAGVAQTMWYTVPIRFGLE